MAGVWARGLAGVGTYFSEARIILDSMGSTGSSAIFRPDYGEGREGEVSPPSAVPPPLKGSPRPHPTALPPYRGELPKVVEGSQSIQLLQSQQQGLIRWWVQEIKVHEVVDPCREK